MLQPELILASTSPRRLELLGQTGLLFRTLAPTTDETPKPRESASSLVLRLAREKARSVAGQLLDLPAVVIAADTTVVAPGGKRILGKPETLIEAEEMLHLLHGRTHTVLTGYCILRKEKLSAPHTKGREVARVVRSQVKMRRLTGDQIAAYAASGESMDKAGAYAAQGLGMALIDEIKGSYTNVVGLPLAQVLADLETRFDIPLFGLRPR